MCFILLTFLPCSIFVYLVYRKLCNECVKNCTRVFSKYIFLRLENDFLFRVMSLLYAVRKFNPIWYVDTFCPQLGTFLQIQIYYVAFYCVKAWPQHCEPDTSIELLFHYCWVKLYCSYNPVATLNCMIWRGLWEVRPSPTNCYFPNRLVLYLATRADGLVPSDELAFRGVLWILHAPLVINTFLYILKSISFCLRMDCSASSRSH